MQQTDNSHVGRFVGQRELVVTPELVQHYTDSVDDHNPRYSGTSAFGDSTAPALLLHSEVYRDLSWYLPQIYGNLHARQEWDLFHPMLVGQTVTTTSTVIHRYIKRNREYIVNEVTCFGGDGRMLNRGRTHQSFLVETDGTAVVVDKDREKRADRRFDISDGEVIEEISGRQKEITLEMCRKFSGPARNYHNDIDAAKKLGFPDIVVQGMMPLCFLSEMMTDRFGVGWFAGGRMNVNLVNVLWQSDKVTCRGIVRSIEQEGAKNRTELDVWSEKEDGTKIVVGTASAISE